MSSLKAREDQKFWAITKGLEWRLDDGGGGAPPPSRPEFFRGGGGGALPVWATHMVAFLLGALTFGWLLVAPVLFPAVVLFGILGLTTLAVRRRWH